MPDHVPPGTPADIGLHVDPELLEDFAERASAEAMIVGAVRELAGLAMVEGAVPGAQLINGCIGIRQTVEPFIDELYDELNQLYLDIHAGLATLGDADDAGAAAIGEAGCR